MPKEEVINRILNAAKALFVQQGVNHVTTDMLAKAAKTSKMTLYKYFSNKETLLNAVVDREVARAFEPYHQSYQTKQEFVEMLFNVSTSLLDTVFEPDIIRFDLVMMSQALSNKPMSKAHYDKTHKQGLAVFTDIISDGQARGFIEQKQTPLFLADAYMSSLSGQRYTKAMFGFQQEDLNHTAHVIDVMKLILNLKFEATGSRKRNA